MELQVYIDFETEPYATVTRHWLDKVLEEIETERECVILDWNTKCGCVYVYTKPKGDPYGS